MALRRLAANRDLISANLLRSLSAAPSSNRSFNQLSNHPQIPNSSDHRPSTSPPSSFPRMFDPLAAPARSATQVQLMNQHMEKCNPFVSASGIMGIGGAGSIGWGVRGVIQPNLYKTNGVTVEMKRSITSTVESATQKSASDEKLQPHANIIRPLSPHLPIYKPQTNSVASIFNRISGAYLAVAISAFYLLTLKLGPICLTYYPFYQVLFYSSKLALISAEVAVLAMAYHVFHSFPHLFADFSAILFLKRLGRK